MGKAFGLRRALCASLVAVVSATVAAAPAGAAQRTQTVTCGGQQITVRTNTNHSSQNGGWGTATIVSGGTGRGSPVAFSAQLLDTTAGQTVFTFSARKGKGHAEHNQRSITCTQQQTGTVGDFVPPNAPLPPGVALGDQATFTLTVMVVPKGHTTIGG
jgi:hypothetical protein